MLDSAADVDVGLRVRSWAHRSQEFFGRIIPRLMDECDQLRHETTELRSYVVTLQEEIDRLQRERGAIAEAAQQIGLIANRAIKNLQRSDRPSHPDLQSNGAPPHHARRRSAKRRRS